MVLDLEKMISGIQGNQISYCLNIKQPFISMAAFGICTAVKISYGQNPI